jgi:tetratricopeptide (TPR) repeat protein
MQELLDSVPQVVDEQLQRATDAIEAGEREQALAALDLAEQIEAENARLPALRSRADSLEQLLPLLQQAADAEAGGDLAAAERALEQATGLDPEHRRAAAELERVSGLYVQQQFNDAMSDGYSALDESRFSAARKFFRRAENLQPGSSEAASALRETESAEIAYRLAALKRSGSSHEASEQWQEAVKAYEAAAKVDPDVLFAREGLARSRPRAQLDKQFRKAIAEPERLSDVAVAEVVEKLLAQARTLEPQGPVLRQQIRRLDELLRKASTPIQLTLRSDMETEVTLYKVRRLGRFDQTSLSLRPGEYTAVGTRIGYRDVRKTFTLSHEGDNPPVVIACTEPI